MTSLTNHSLAFLPCIDSASIAQARRRELDIARDVAAQLGKSAVEAAEVGYYLNSDNATVNWQSQVKNACDAKLSIAPHDALPSPAKQDYFHQTRVRVANQTTLQAARIFAGHGLRPLALNFANGIAPGGGFLNGALAQEEALCRCSALYQTLVGDAMYDAHRKRAFADSTDWAIYSPQVPVFRNDDGTVLSAPWLLSFITCAAPVAYKIGTQQSAELLRKRIHRVLAIARAYQYSALVLGAWGCGVFANDAHQTASDFRGALEGEFAGAFSDITFAVCDWSVQRKFLAPFRDVFSA